MLRLLRRWMLHRREEEEPLPGKETEDPKSFFLYIRKAPEILTYIRREQGIARRELELTVIDCEEEPAWQVQRILEALIGEARVLCVITGRPECFRELSEEAFDEEGMLVTVMRSGQEPPPGNLVFDLRDWEKHLDIVPRVGYD